MTLLLFLFSLLAAETTLSAQSERSCLNQEHSIEAIFDIGTVQNLIISKDDAILLEQYRRNMSGDRNVNIKSASKSVLSLLIGIAIDRGYLASLDLTLADFFPEYFERKPDPVKEAITLEDLLTMRSGLETTSFRNYGRWVLSSNWSESVLDQPIIAEPGTRMIYSTGTSHLLSVILTKASGMSTKTFADRYLFEPLNIRSGGWDHDPQGYYFGGNNMALSPRDLIRIGELMLHTGIYNGEQIVSREWILASTQIYTRSNFNPYYYGYMWWRKRVAEREIFFAWGNGGQYIFILPEYVAVLSVTSALRSDGSRNYQREMFLFMERVIIPYLECLETFNPLPEPS